ncbi:MAG: FAD-binding oxidoreductase, partial [FCB group bacterium]|nr:FAD-binding oxidoreductase [FCB group bacterium]
MSLKAISLRDVLPADCVAEGLIDRLAYAHDASIYRYVPEAVVRPANEEQVIKLLAFARRQGKSVTFRTGGTSLSGQSVTDGIIAETVRDWKTYQILDGGAAIKLEPGIVGEYANRLLHPYCRRIGPDPASIKAAMIGGIVSNNASGMACGIQNNSYHTLRYIRFILANGNTYDTGIKQDYDRFVVVESELAAGLADLRQHILRDQQIADRIRYKYRLKNTLGYSINAFLDYEHPLDIFSHLLIGAEGTLAFISNITLNTIPDPPCKTTGLLLFESMKTACAIIPTLKELGAEAVELMDYASLSTARYVQDPPYDFSAIKPGSGALLCEFQGETNSRLIDAEKAVVDKLPDYRGEVIGGFRFDDRERSKLWRIRKGLYPTVGSLRRTGTSVITEDICFDIEHLAEAVIDLQ